jgi:type VI secretion system secreted protein VgrG
MATPVGGNRGLTEGEEKMARLIFGNSIDYTRVRIHNKKWRSFFPDKVAMTPNGEIFFHPSDFQEDFSDSSISPRERHLFIHEMTHVWQYQLDFPVMAQGLLSAFKYGYKYTLKPDSKLSDFSMEGQGNIIADYAMYIIDKMASWYSGMRYEKTTPYTLQELQAVLVDFIANPSNKMNLPEIIKPAHCKIDSTSADCI